MKGRSIAIGLAVLLPVAGVAAAVAVGGGGDDKPAVLRVLDNGSGAGAESATLGAPAADSDSRSANLSMLAYVTYEAGPDLPELDGKAHAYRVTTDGDPAAVAARIAEAFGVEGTAQERDGQWIVSATDREVSVFPSAGMQWSAYSLNPVAVEDAARSSEECKVDGECVSVPVEPTRPANLPSKADAQDIALDFLDSIGVDVTNAHVQVDDGITTWGVTVEPVVDGLRTFGLGSYVGVGDKGVIEYASGSLASFEKADEYELIGTRAAIDQMNEQSTAYASDTPAVDTLEAQSDVDSGSGSASGGAVAPDTPVCNAEPCDTGEVVSDPSCAADACSTPGFAGGGTDGSTVTIEPLPADSEPVAPPEPTVITLTDGEVGLMYYPSFDNSDGWLVPAYLFTDGTENTGVYTAVAIAQEFLAPMEPVTPARGAVETDPAVDSPPPVKTDD